MEFDIDHAGQLCGIGFQSLREGKQTILSVSSPAWGVDRQIQRSSPTQAERDGEQELFNRDIESRKNSPRPDFSNFNAVSPLRRWGQIDRDIFLAWAERFLVCFAQTNLLITIELQFFAVTVEEELLRIKPESVLHTWHTSPRTFDANVACYAGTVDSHVACLWEPELNQSSEIREERRRQLLEASNDEEILWHVLAAHAKGNSIEITALATEWLNSDAARVRALAVTLLAFHGDGELLKKLQEIRESDPSYWVRDHAGWAVDACATELIVRKRYHEILVAQSLAEISAGIVELRPALSPMAFAWRLSEENRRMLATQSSRNRAVIELFWYHVDHSSTLRENPSVAGRKLKEFCRGERLKDGISSKMAPWWNPG